MKQEYRTCRIADIAEKVAMGPFGSNIKVETFVPAGVPIISGAHLKGFYLEENDFNFITEEHAQRLKNAIVYPGDIIFTHAGNVGQAAMIPYNCHYPFYMISQRQFYLRCNKEKVLPEYLTYYFHSYEGLGKLLSNVSQVGVPSIAQPSSFLKTIEIPLPSLDVQRRIVNVLDSFTKKIEVNNQINQNLEEQAFSVYNNLCNEAKQQCELNSIAVLNPLRSLQKGTVALCVDMAQLSTSSAYPNPGIYKSYGGGMKFQNGDTLLARITPCLENGKTAYIDFLKDGEVAFGSTEYIVLSSRGKMPPQFFYCLARDKRFRDYATKHMNGSSGRQRVSADALEKYMIPSISEEDMKQFGQNVEPLFRLMRQKADENIRLSSLRDTLLPKLISGEINI